MSGKNYAYNDQPIPPVNWVDGGQFTLSSHYISPQVLMTAVPEPMAIAVAGGLCLGLFAGCRWLRSGGSRPE